MKLVDILARELKSWPEGNYFAWQDYDREIRFSYATRRDFHASILADDHVRSRHGDDPDYGVTRAEWQAAVDALNAPKVVEWDGVGDPPEMSKIEYKSVGGAWKKGVFVGRVYGKIVAGCDETEVVGWLPSDEMRPIRTAEQVAAEERNKVIREMVAEVTEEPRARHFAFCEALYDAGYRKEPKPCGS